MANIIDCPSCHRRLRVPDELLGANVKCPTCGSVFTTSAPQAAAPPPAAPQPFPEPPAEVPPRERVSALPPNDPGFEAGDTGYPFEPSLHRGRLQPHRGTLILIFGILSLVVCGLFGPIAWVMGSNDLAEMRAGRMDPAGQGTTEAGRVCGIIASVFMILTIVCGCGFFMLSLLGAHAF